MNEALVGVWEHMRDLGLGALAHANRHAAYFGMENDRWPELSVLQAAHAAELLFKARIAEEHPLLVFDQLPKSSAIPGVALTLQALLEHGRTVQWADIPERLWVTTGLSIPSRTRFESFGRLRNAIQHFTAPQGLDLAEETLQFVFDVIDPFIQACWGLFAIDFDEDYEPYLYFVQSLVHREIPFLVSSKAASTFKDWDVEWSTVSDEYRSAILKKVESALA